MDDGRHSCLRPDSNFVYRIHCKHGRQSVTPTVPTTPLTFQEQLEAIDGISDITVEKTKNGTDAYHFFVDQLIDHNDPGKGTFKQRVAMTYKGAGHTTVLYTEGYMMGSNGKNIRWTDLYDQYDANTIEVEHRYFGESLPEPIENVNYTYLNCEQAAEDLHHVVAVAGHTIDEAYKITADTRRVFILRQ